VANTIRIKRRAIGGGTGAPSSLANAELAFNEDSEILYYGLGAGGAGGTATSALPIAGPGAFISSATTRNANVVLAGPTTGSAATPTFRALVAADIPDLSSVYLALAGGTVGGNLTVSGNLTVNGTTTTINSTTVSVDDKTFELGAVTSPDDSTADGGGLVLKGATDKTWLWVDATDAWTSSEHVNLASGKSYYINGTQVLSGTALGTGVTSSSLTSVGTLTSGALGTGFTTVAVAQGGTGATTLTGLVKGNGTSAFSAAVAGTDYLSPSSEIDGGSF
jgi:hypothetical protein